VGFPNQQNTASVLLLPTWLMSDKLYYLDLFMINPDKDTLANRERLYGVDDKSKKLIRSKTNTVRMGAHD
jgi:hypothetical protein